MSNNNVKGLFDALTPSAAQKERIYDRIGSFNYDKEDARTGGNMNTRSHRHIMGLRPAFVGSVVCVAIALLCIWTIPHLLNTPNNPIDTNTSTTPSNSGHDNPSTVTPNNPILGAVYHDVDISQLNYQGDVGKVPYGFFFAQRLTLLANNETNINLNNGVRWESGQFEMTDVENALQASINATTLPDGDYTFGQRILIDEVTGRTIAYQTTYTYFTLETMVFEGEFSVFYFSLDDFMRRNLANLEQSENIVFEDGEITIHDFSTPVVNESTRVPHTRRLVYINNGSAIVIEAITAPIMIDDAVDETSSLERYKQSDKELIGIMMSLVG